MTLREFLVKQQHVYLGALIRHIGELDKDYRRAEGKIFMCSDLIDLLSDETLNMEVETRAEAAAKARKNTTCCRCCCQYKKGE